MMNLYIRLCRYVSCPSPGCAGCAVFGPVCVPRVAVTMAMGHWTLPHIATHCRQHETRLPRLPSPSLLLIAPISRPSSRKESRPGDKPSYHRHQHGSCWDSLLIYILIHRVHLKVTNISLLIKCYLPRCLDKHNARIALVVFFIFQEL